MIIILFPWHFLIASDIAMDLSGKILLAVEKNGEAWYINPANTKRYYLNRPTNAFDIMKTLGVGITTQDLSRIPVGLIENSNLDTDNDGLSDNLETALGTDLNNSDTDGDNYSDLSEVQNNYNPLIKNSALIDYVFAEKHKGKILLAVEQNGEAWYVNPENLKKYYLGRPADAFEIMRELSLGINNKNLNNIAIGYIATNPSPPEPEPTPFPSPDSSAEVFSAVADAIRAQDKNLTSSYFIPEMKKRIEYAVENMSAESLLILGNILSGSKITSSTSNKVVYSNDVFVSLADQYVHLEFTLEKQDNEEWLLINI